jgi:hypothetical protein
MSLASTPQANSRPTILFVSNQPVCFMLLTLFYFAGPLVIAAELLRPALSIPLLIFFLVWLRAFSGFVFGDVPALHAFRAYIRITLPPREAIAPAIAVFVLAATWIYFSGIGSFTYCRYDYIKHNLIFTSLLGGHLPISTGRGGGDIVHFYFAYYIIPVRLFEMLQPIFDRLRLEHVTFALYCLALVGSLRLLASSLRVPVMGLLLLMVFTGGLDLVGRFLLGPGLREMGRVRGIPYFFDLDWWGVPYAPQSLTLNLFWAPQHLFAAIIGTALICSIFALARPRRAQLLHVACVVAASALWSPYVAIGLAVVVLGVMSKLLFRDTFAAVPSASAPAGPRAGFAGAAGFLILLSAFVLVFFAAAKPASPPSVIFFHAGLGPWLLSFILRFTPAIVALAALWLRRGRGSDGSGEAGDLGRSLAFLLAAGACLLSLTHGAFDDWAMRTTLPVSILVAAGLCRFLLAGLGDAARIVVTCLLILSSASSVNEFAQSAFLPHQCAAYGSYAWSDLGQFVDQYRGNGDSVLYRWLVRKPGP